MVCYRYLATESIPLIYLSRNPFFVLVSRAKHRAHPDLPAHCYPGEHEAKCLESFANATFEMQTGSSLTAEIQTQVKRRDWELELMANLSIPHIYVTFESLFMLPGQINVWRRMLNFVQPQRADVWATTTLDDVHNSLGTTSTSAHVPLSEQILNYDDVIKTMEGSQFAYLLNASAS